MTTTAPIDVAGDAPIGVCGAGVWLLAATGPEPLDEYRAYRTHCHAPPNHLGDHNVRVVGEPDDADTPAQPVTLAWPNNAALKRIRASLRVLHKEWDDTSSPPGSEDWERLVAAIKDTTRRLIAAEDEQARTVEGHVCTCAPAPSQGPT